jgi:hypothetical protein
MRETSTTGTDPAQPSAAALIAAARAAPLPHLGAPGRRARPHQGQ